MHEDIKDSKLQLGTEVTIIGPSNSGGYTHYGERFVISEILTRSEGKSYSSSTYFGWFPANSLRLVEEELKIGDMAEVLVDGYGKKIGDVFCIDSIVKGRIPGDLGPYYSANNWPLYSRSELRKLTPDEVEQHTTPKDETSSKIKQFDGEIAHLLASVQEYLIESGDVEARTKCREMKITDRLSVIEHRQEIQQKLLSQLETHQDNHDKQLTNVEFLLSEIEKRLELIK